MATCERTGALGGRAALPVPATFHGAAAGRNNDAAGRNSGARHAGAALRADHLAARIGQFPGAAGSGTAD
jgi:hypothetical protein